MKNFKLTKNLSYYEAIKSSTAIRKGIRNIPSSSVLNVMKLTASKLFQPIRDHFKVPIGVTSFFRSKILNKRIGGSKNSQHIKGEAIDIDAHIYGKISNKDIFNYIKFNLEFDQLIWEFGTEDEPAWVHVSYSENNNRGIILRAYKEKNIFNRYVTKYKRIY